MYPSRGRVWMWITLTVTSIRAVRTLHHAPTHTRSTLHHTPTHTHSRTPAVMLKLLVNLLIVSSRSNIRIEGMTSFPLNLPLAYSRWSFTFSKQYLCERGIQHGIEKWELAFFSRPVQFLFSLLSVTVRQVRQVGGSVPISFLLRLY
jgi:hypothetical protein